MLLPLLTAIARDARATARAARARARSCRLPRPAPPRSPASCSPTRTRCSTSTRSAPASPDSARLASGEELAKLGLTQRNGVVYYLWSLTWGLGWIPALAALGGALRLLLRDRRLALVLLPAPLLYVLFMGLQERYFGRWLLPVLPIVIAARGVRRDGARARGRRRARRGWRCRRLRSSSPRCSRRGSSHSLHVDRVLARARHARRARAPGCSRTCRPARRVVIEPFVPARWLEDPDRADPATPGGGRWRLWDTARADVDDAGRPLPAGSTRFVKVDKYERTLRPALIDRYVAQGYCWVVTGSTPVRARVRAARRGPAGDRLLRRARAPRRGRGPLQPLPRRRAAAAVQLRLVVRLLPARVRAPGPADRRAPPARRRSAAELARILT